jgi:hypothetical protein
MSQHDPRALAARADLGVKCRHHPKDHPVVLAAREHLDAVNTEIRCDRAVTVLEQDWLKLSHQQMSRVIKLLRTERS